MIKPRSMRHVLPTTPLPMTKHLYAGKPNDYFTTGNNYYVISSGYHWHKEAGFGIWMTNDKYTNNKHLDEDYGYFISVDTFNSVFIGQ